jgi:hypothetical protein
MIGELRHDCGLWPVYTCTSIKKLRSWERMWEKRITVSFRGDGESSEGTGDCFSLSMLELHMGRSLDRQMHQVGGPLSSTLQLRSLLTVRNVCVVVVCCRVSYKSQAFLVSMIQTHACILDLTYISWLADSCKGMRESQMLRKTCHLHCQHCMGLGVNIWMPGVNDNPLLVPVKLELARR